MNASNPMRAAKIEKVVVNIGVGEGGEKLLKAEKVLQLVTGKKPVRTLTRVTNKDWGLKPGAPIGCKVTLRNKAAEKFLKDAFWVRDNKIPTYSFDKVGNFSFGIPDYTDFPGMKYDPSIGIFGMDVCVRLAKAGTRIQTRKRCRTKIPAKQKLTLPEAVEFIKNKFNTEVVE